MSSYRFFNVKVLPLSGKKDELIGKDGYRQLLEQFQRTIRKAHLNRDLLSVSFPLLNDFYFSVLHIRTDIPYGHGKFLKFDKPGTLVDTLTGDPLQSVPQNASAHRFEFRFVFDYTRHVIAVQFVSGKSPGAPVQVKALRHLLAPVVAEHFPSHYLEVEVLTSDAELARVLNTVEKFKRAEVHVSATNTDEYLDEEIRETEEEMANLNISDIKHTETAPAKGFMSGLSLKMQALLQIAKKNGNASIRYLEKQSGKLKSYVMHNHPIQTKVPMPKKMNEVAYLDAVHSALIDADNQSKR